MPRYDTVLYLVIVSSVGERLVLVYLLFITFKRNRMNPHPFRTGKMRQRLGIPLP